MSKNISELQRRFRAQGWNLAGANLLAASCWFANSAYLYVRPKLGTADFLRALAVLAVGVSVVMGSASTLAVQKVFFTGLISVLSGILLGGFYLLYRASSWKPVNEIIKEELDRETQKELVVTLADVCQKNYIDPEDLDRLHDELKCLELNNNKALINQFHRTLVKFFLVKLQMQE